MFERYGRAIIGTHTKGEAARRMVQESRVEISDLGSEVIVVNLTKETLIISTLFTALVSFIAGAGVMYLLHC